MYPCCKCKIQCVVQILFNPLTNTCVTSPNFFSKSELLTRPTYRVRTFLVDRSFGEQFRKGRNSTFVICHHHSYFSKAIGLAHFRPPPAPPHLLPDRLLQRVKRSVLTTLCTIGPWVKPLSSLPPPPSLSGSKKKRENLILSVYGLFSSMSSP